MSGRRRDGVSGSLSGSSQCRFEAPNHRASSLSPVRELRSIRRLPHSEDAGGLIERVRDAVVLRRRARRCFLLLATRAVRTCQCRGLWIEQQGRWMFLDPRRMREMAGWQVAASQRAAVDRALGPGAAVWAPKGSGCATGGRLAQLFFSGNRTWEVQLSRGLWSREKGTGIEFQPRQLEENRHSRKWKLSARVLFRLFSAA
jgi:hypothetical protein